MGTYDNNYLSSSDYRLIMFSFSVALLNNYLTHAVAVSSNKIVYKKRNILIEIDPKY